MSLTQYTVGKDGSCGLFSPSKRNRNAAVIVLEDGHPADTAVFFIWNESEVIEDDAENAGNERPHRR